MTASLRAACVRRLVNVISGDPQFPLGSRICLPSRSSIGLRIPLSARQGRFDVPRRRSRPRFAVLRRAPGNVQIDKSTDSSDHRKAATSSRRCAVSNSSLHNRFERIPYRAGRRPDGRARSLRQGDRPPGAPESECAPHVEYEVARGRYHSRQSFIIVTVVREQWHYMFSALSGLIPHSSQQYYTRATKVWQNFLPFPSAPCPIRGVCGSPPFRLERHLSDWPDCRLELHCCRGTTSLPLRLLSKKHGDIAALSLGVGVANAASTVAGDAQATRNRQTGSYSE
jgi:hypothetical protein